MSRHVVVTVAVISSLALSGCGQAGDTDRDTGGQKLAEGFSPAAQAAAPAAQSAQAFVDSIAADSAWQIAAAQMAEQRSGDADTKAFAAQMAQDHAVIAAELGNVLKRTHGLAADPRLAPAQQKALDDLRAAGSDFDAVYAKQQVSANEQELTVLRDYADNGMDPALSEFAAGAANMAADHLRAARGLS
jgi:putative membrane protein